MAETKRIKHPVLLLIATVLMMLAGLILLNRYAGSSGGEDQSSITGNKPHDVSGTEQVGEPRATAISSKPPAREISPGQAQEAFAEAEPAHRFATKFYDARTAEVAAQAIELAESENLPIANDWMAALEGFCYDASEGREYRSGRQWLDERQSDFCAGYLTKKLFGNTLPLEELYRSTMLRQTQREVADILGQLEASGHSDYITLQVKNARWPEEVQAIQLALVKYREQSSTSASPWNPLERDAEDWRKRYSPTYTRSQDLALHMYRCYKFRSCGPKSINFMTTCSVLPECEEWWTIDDYFYYTSTPLEVQTAYEILQKLQ